MPKREKEGKVHMHVYDDNWKCACGFRLVTESGSDNSIVNIKAFVTPEGETIPLREAGKIEGDEEPKSGKKKKNEE